jgi:hypothetical protein
MPDKPSKSDAKAFSGETGMELSYELLSPTHFRLDIEIARAFPQEMPSSLIESLLLTIISSHTAQIAAELNKEKPWTVQMFDTSNDPEPPPPPTRIN